MKKLLFVLAVSLLACNSDLLASDPTLSVITPRGAQRGTEQVFRFSGARLEDAEEIFFYEPGFEVLEIKPVNANTIDVKIRIAEDCELGEHTAQVRTKSGVSDYRTFFIGALPNVDEKEPNTEFSAPQIIEMNVTVNGVVQNEDVDYFEIEARKGQRLSVEVEGMRFGQTLFDPYIAILDQRRFELTAVDDSPLVRQDAVTSIVVPEDGRYIIEVRESGYGGNGNCRYRLHVGTFARPLAVFPPGGKAGEEVELSFIGDALGPFSKKVTLPADGTTETLIFPEDESGISPSGHIVRISPVPNALEAEPNNSFEQATVCEFPCSFNGVLQEPGDVDVFRFTAKKGQVFDVECFGRRIRSAIDPVMNIYLGNGKGVAGNDDSRGPDSYIKFTAPEDGEYLLRIADHLGRGGPEYTYRVEFQDVKPSLTLGIPRVARYSQSRQQIYVPRGGRFATLISADRQNFGGDLVMEDIQLPPGIKMISQPMPGNQNTMPVVFEAAADAPIGGALVDFRMKASDPNLNVSGRFINRADFVIANPGQSLYVWKDVERLPVAVVEELPFSIEIVQPQVPIVRNGSVELKIVATKKEGWDEDISVQFPYRPPGVGANSAIKIPKGQNEGLYLLNANGNAALGAWPVYAIASANVNGAAWTASQMATLEIAEPYIGIALKRSSVEVGQETEILGDVDVLKELKSPAVATLMGLPHKVTAEPLQITPETKELVFKIKTEADSPPGTHKNIFCQVVVTENNEPITHARVGSTEIRIDKPIPKPAAEPMPQAAVAKAEPAKPAPPAEKRLSRLEKLRLEAQKIKEGTP
ncbi:MAG: PPC domain-containing protein [Planctomycetaceae bacterium]|nr:PPC domain-containing protein [Planctomycetaceae bacterium]